MESKHDRDEAVRKLAELIGEMRIAMLTTMTEDGRLWSRPVTTHGSRFDGDLWFLTRRSSPKSEEVRLHHQVSVSYTRLEDNTYVSLSGQGKVVVDREKAEELWDPSYKKWFPGGPDDPDLALIHVEVERAEYWNAPSLAWFTEAGFVVLAPGQKDDPQYHARVEWKRD